MLEGVGVNSTRTAFLDVVKEMGGNVVLKNLENITNEPRADIASNAKQELKGISIQGKKIPNLIDEIPLIAIMGLFAKGQTTVRDAKELRFKESDRISLLLSNIKKFDPKATVTEYEDGFDIKPSNNLDTNSVNIETGGDHRIIMSFMIASLGSGKEVVFDETSSVETSFPGFFEVLKKWFQ